MPVHLDQDIKENTNAALHLFSRKHCCTFSITGWKLVYLSSDMILGLWSSVTSHYHNKHPADFCAKVE